MEPVRLCGREEEHMEHRYWMNFHGDDAYDESFWCPGVDHVNGDQ